MPAQQVVLTLSDEFLRDVDRVAEQDLRSRAEVLLEALRLYVASRKAWRPIDTPAFRHQIEQRAGKAH